MKWLGVVPARSGSKGIPNKNLQRIGDFTLLELAVKFSKSCPAISKTLISTDSSEYESIGKRAGAESLGLRSKELSADSTKTVDVLIDLILGMQESFDGVALFQPTAPIRQPLDFETMNSELQKMEAEAAVSLERMDEPHPFKLKTLKEGNWVQAFVPDTSSELPRQSLPPVFKLNGAIYLCRTETLLKQKTLLPVKTIGHLMPRGVNIDTEWDLILLRELVRLGAVNLPGTVNP